MPDDRRQPAQSRRPRVVCVEQGQQRRQCTLAEVADENRQRSLQTKDAQCVGEAGLTTAILAYVDAAGLAADQQAYRVRAQQVAGDDRNNHLYHSSSPSPRLRKTIFKPTPLKPNWARRAFPR